LSSVPQTQIRVRTTRGIQQLLLSPPPRLAKSFESRGVVYTKQWVVELLLDLAGYLQEENLVDAVAVEPAAGEGA
jgi:adenine-specific DNA-methyltransferase